MAEIILVCPRARCKRSRAARGRFLVARRASSGRAEMSHVQRSSCARSSHNTSRLKPFQIWPIEWSKSAVAIECGEAQPFRSRFARASLPQRPRQPAGSGRAARFSGPRGLAEAFIEGLRGRARPSSAHGDNGEHPRSRARATTCARRTREASPSRRVPALRLGGAGDGDRTVREMREGARCR
jgi:hypothetical protein